MTNSEFKSIRLELKMTQTEFAEILGVKMRTVQAMESGERKVKEPVARLAKIIRVFGIQLLKELDNERLIDNQDFNVDDNWNKPV